VNIISGLLPYSVLPEFWKQLPKGEGWMDSENLRAVGLMGSSAEALEELESLPTRDSIVKHFLLCWNIVVGYKNTQSIKCKKKKMNHTSKKSQKDNIYIVPLQSITS